MVLRLFCDRSISWLGFEVQALAEHYGEQPGQLGADARVRRNPAERRMLCLSAARYLVYPNNNISTAEKLARIRDHRAAIEAVAAEPGPWVRHLTARELTLVALDCGSV